MAHSIKTNHNGDPECSCGYQSPPVNGQIAAASNVYKHIREANLVDKPAEHDPVNHPSHYTSHPSGVECIEITRHMPFNTGNAVKYLWRAGLKDNAPTKQDYEKAIWYIQDEIKRLFPEPKQKGMIDLLDTTDKCPWCGHEVVRKAAAEVKGSYYHPFCKNRKFEAELKESQKGFNL